MGKRPLSAYFFYLKDVREETKENNPDLKMVQITKLIAEQWAKMSKRDKKKYSEKAVEAKNKYKEERKKYEQSSKYKKFKKDLKEWRDLYEEEWEEQEYEKEQKREERKKEKKSQRRKRRKSQRR